MTTHVFIVDSNTFKYHLEYMFAGTGAKDLKIDFNGKKNSELNHTVENNLVGMIADSQRIRKNDLIVFYLQQDIRSGIYEGKFYGIFKAVSDLSFLDNKQFLKKELNKSLILRTLIEPYEVYKDGVSEWEALDEIKSITSPNQMLWSLIYRKLKGNRGNTMITMYESERLFKLIREKNGNQKINGKSYSFDIQTQQIITINKHHIYSGTKENINILPRLFNKYTQNKAFEPHLQCYIVQNIGRNTDERLDRSILINDYLIEWIGNEVSCGVGMQKIDIMLSLTKKNSICEKRIVLPIELKAKRVNVDNLTQLQRYIDWLEQYYIPNRISDIQPVLIGRKIEDKTSEKYRQFVESISVFNNRNDRHLPLKYVEYEVIGKHLQFESINYNNT